MALLFADLVVLIHGGSILFAGLGGLLVLQGSKPSFHSLTPRYAAGYPLTYGFTERQP